MRSCAIGTAGTHAFALRQGPASVALTLPPAWAVDAVSTPAAVTAWTSADVEHELRRAGLVEAARGARRVVVLTPDATRVARSDLYLPPILDLVREGGGGEATVVLATGTHAAPGGAAREALLGAAAASGVPVVQHDCRDAAALVDVGPTARGGPLLLARAAVEADLVILTGRVTNHYFAGFTGGAKAVLPGVAGLVTVERNHRQVLDEHGRLERRARNGRVDDNPVRREMAAAAAALPGRTFLVNTVVDAQRQIAELFAGAVPAAHARACGAAAAACRVPVDRPYDVVVASCGGAPFDGNLMQSLKTVADWAPAVRRGGVLVWLTGMGTAGLDLFRRWLTVRDTDELRAAAVRAYDLRAHNSIILRTVQEWCRVVLVAPLPAAVIAELGFVPAAGVDAALAVARGVVGDRARCLVVSDGNATWADTPDGPP